MKSDLNKRNNNIVLQRLYKKQNWTRRNKTNTQYGFTRSANDNLDYLKALFRDAVEIAPVYYIHPTFKQTLSFKTADGMWASERISREKASLAMDVFGQKLSRKLWNKKALKENKLIAIRGFFQGDPNSSSSGKPHFHFHGVIGHLPQKSQDVTDSKITDEMDKAIIETWHSLQWSAPRIQVDHINNFNDEGRKSGVKLLRYGQKKHHKNKSEDSYFFGPKK